MRMAVTCMRAAQSGVRAAGDGAANARRAGATVCARAVCISECYSEQRTADARKTTRRGKSFLLRDAVCRFRSHTLMKNRFALFSVTKNLVRVF